MKTTRIALALVAASLSLTTSAQLPNPLSSKEKESLSNSDINLVLLSNKSAVDKCQDEHKKKEPNVKGQLLVRFQIETNGSTSNVGAISPQLKDTTFSRCVVDVVKKLSFPKHKNKGKPVDQTFTF